MLKILPLDPKLKTLLKAAVAAPSGDNLQPWRFRIKNEKEIDFLFDPRVDQSFFNYEQNASIFAVGAAFENASYLLSRENIKHKFIFDFSKENSLIKIGTLKIDWPDGEFEFKTPLAKTPIMKRHTNRKFYEKVNLSDKEMAEITKLVADLPVKVKVLRGKELKAIADIVYFADLIRVERKDLHEFLHDTIRWTEEEILTSRDGMPVATLEAGKAGENFLRFTRPWPVMKTFLRLGVSRHMADYARKLVLSSEGVFAFFTDELGPRAYFEAGRTAERLWLALTEKGLAVQPMAAAPLFMIRWRRGRYLDFSARHQFFMRKIERGFEKLGIDKPLMLLRFGKAPLPSATALRKEVEDFLLV
ncbi:nitroreductase [Thermodesulfatator indicus DSM 15286]|uniref:Nitroreductase n=1 Tax=Thermodesulfatator indicus (strain DSM 15286 / JCM 11887 / CIR29812) TaxID=667014 RepID=F8AA18_THEID|nr:nitroreductase [Thermodesulfatator indicus]AEH45304.1 nitroreductase [Thermodesulfatator indicus DSM 15286]